MSQKPMTLNQMMQTYQLITSDFNEQRIDKAAYSAALVRLKAMDAENRWWACTSEGGFAWYDGKSWVPGLPPGYLPAANPKPPLKEKSASKGWRKIASTPILAILPGAVVGSLWFFYTFLQLIFGGQGGVDFLTPTILTGVPLLLWLLRKPLDKLLHPLQKLSRSFPFALRLGLVLVLPMMLGCGCSMISTTGYSAIHFTALISTLFGYFLLHTPAAK